MSRLSLNFTARTSQLNNTAQALHMRINYLEHGHMTHDISDLSQLWARDWLRDEWNWPIRYLSKINQFFNCFIEFIVEISKVICYLFWTVLITDLDNVLDKHKVTHITVISKKKKSTRLQITTTITANNVEQMHRTFRCKGLFTLILWRRGESENHKKNRWLFSLQE